MPCFFNKNPENKKEFETNSDFFKEILGKKIKFINGAEYLSLNDLVEISKRNFSKFLIFSYDKEQTETFLKYCKTCNVKVHSCLKTIFSLGWKILNLKYGQNLGTIKFRFPISVRNHLIKKYLQWVATDIKKEKRTKGFINEKIKTVLKCKVFMKLNVSTLTPDDIKNTFLK